MQPRADTQSHRDDYSACAAGFCSPGAAGMYSEENRYVRDYFPWEGIRSDGDCWYSQHVSKSSLVSENNPRSLNRLSSDDVRYCKADTHSWPKNPSDKAVAGLVGFGIDDRDRFGKPPAAGMDNPPDYVRLRSPRAGSPGLPHDPSPRSLRTRSPRRALSPRSLHSGTMKLEDASEKKGFKWDDVSVLSDEESEVPSCSSRELGTCRNKNGKPGASSQEQERAAGTGPTCHELWNQMPGPSPSSSFRREAVRATTAAAYSAAAKRNARPPPRSGCMPGVGMNYAAPRGFTVARHDEVMDIVSDARKHAVSCTPPRSRPPSVDHSPAERKAMLEHFACVKLGLRNAPLGTPQQSRSSSVRSSSVRSDRKGPRRQVSYDHLGRTQTRPRSQTATEATQTLIPVRQRRQGHYERKLECSDSEAVSLADTAQISVSSSAQEQRYSEQNPEGFEAGVLLCPATGVSALAQVARASLSPERQRLLEERSESEAGAPSEARRGVKPFEDAQHVYESLRRPAVESLPTRVAVLTEVQQNVRPTIAHVPKLYALDCSS